MTTPPISSPKDISAAAKGQRNSSWKRSSLGWVLLGMLGLPPLLTIYVHWATRDRRYVDPAQIRPERVAVVFGAAVYADGTLSPMLADRVDAAIALYRQGQVQKILMTGDNGTPYYNEVTTMERYAVDRGIPETDITLDYAGFSTYESCYRAREIFGLKQAVLVTQKFHLPRAIYTCRHLGIDAVGLGTEDWKVYGRSTMLPNLVRETFATVKAVFELHITHPKPTFLGNFEGVD